MMTFLYWLFCIREPVRVPVPVRRPPPRWVQYPDGSWDLR